MSDRQKITIALVLSALLHLLVLGFFGIFNEKLSPVKAPPVAAQPTPLEIEIARFSTPTPRPKIAGATPTPTPTPKGPVERELIDSAGLAQASKPKPNALLESDQDLQAGSMLPAVGNVPMPSQTGRTLPFTKFQNQRYTPGQRPGSSAASRPSKPAPPPQPPQKSQEPQPASAPDVTPPPVATPAPSLTPPPAEDQLFALGRPTPVPTPSRAPRTLDQLRRELAMLRPTTPMPPQPQPAPQQQQQPGYQPQSERTAMEGGISNRGATGVDAVATTRGRFQKAISDAIGSRWYYYVNQRMDLVTVGNATVRFKIDAQGHPHDARVVRNSSNETFASVCIQAVREANFPPVPQELMPMMQDGSFEIDYNFTIYPQ